MLFSVLDICGKTADEMKRRVEWKMSKSFMTGVIALVFLVVGYQTALFIHNAAVLHIVANRDEPDTVYVYDRNDPETSAGSTGNAGTVRKISSHTKRAENVRRTVPPARVESFVFDPNTVSVEDLCRLGFSRKQAESIDNYRRKGGRFRRKKDFARSFVVSDSIYRRLESYIDIPLVDLNLADSAALDALPGIGGWFASKIIEHRNALRGFSHKEQLMDIYRFDKEKYDGLSDLVTVSPENVSPYPLWTLPADSLRNHPYIPDSETAKAIVLFRENNGKDRWTVDNLREAGVISAETAEKISGCVLAQPDE